ncbi:MAG: hypothetical protein Kow00124_20150 [Anaerolineae bacterium]
MSKDILERAVELSEQGNIAEARNLVTGYLRQNPRDAEAWGILSQLVEDRDRRIDCLERALRFAEDDFTRTWAQEQLDALLGLAPPAPPAAPEEPAPEAEEPEAPLAVEEPVPEIEEPEAPLAVEEPAPEIEEEDLFASLGMTPWEAGPPPAEEEPGEEEDIFAALAAEGEPTPEEAEGFLASLGLTAPLEGEAGEEPALSLDAFDWLREPEGEEEGTALPIEEPSLDLMGVTFGEEEEEAGEEEAPEEQPAGESDLLAALGLAGEPEAPPEAGDIFADLGISADAFEAEPQPEADLLGGFETPGFVSPPLEDETRPIPAPVPPLPVEPAGMEEEIEEEAPEKEAAPPEPEEEEEAPSAAPALTAESERVMLHQAVEMARSGQRTEAGKLVSDVLDYNPENAEAWAIMAQLVDDPALEIRCLENVLELSDNPRVRRWAQERLARAERKPRPRKGARGCVRVVLVALLAILLALTGLVAVGVFAPHLLPFTLPGLARLTPTAEPGAEALPSPTLTPTVAAAGPTAVPTFPPTPTLPPTPTPQFGPGIYLLAEQGAADVAVSPDGLIAAAGDQGLLLFESDEAPRTLGEGPLTAAAFAPDGATVATGGADGTVTIWEVASGEALQTLTYGGDNPDEVFALAFSPDGTRLIAGGYAGVIDVFDTETGETLYSIDPAIGDITGLVWIDDDRFAASAGAGGLFGWLRVFDAGTGETQTDLALDYQVESLVLMPGGEQIAFGTRDGALGLWTFDAEEETVDLLVEPTPIDNALLASFPEGWDFIIRDVAAAPDGSLAAARADGTVTLWDAGGDLIRSLNTQAADVRALAWRAGGAELVTATDATVLRWVLAELAAETGGGEPVTVADISLEELASEVVGTGSILAMRYVAADARLIAGDAAGQAVLLDVGADGALTPAGTVPGPVDEIGAIAAGPDGRLMASAFGGGPDVILWETATGDEVTTLLGHTAPVRALAFSLDGRLLASGGDDGMVVVWDVATGEDLQNLSGHPVGLSALAFSADGTLLASGSIDGTVVIWSLETGGPLQIIGPPPIDARVGALVFSPDGAQLVVARTSTPEQGQILFYDVAQGEESEAFNAAAAPIEALVFLPGSPIIAAGSSDGGIAFWDAGALAEISTLQPTFNGMLALAVNPAATLLITGDETGRVTVYRITAG